MYSWQLSSLILKRVNFKYTNSNVNLSSFSKHFSARVKFGGYRKRIDLWFKEQVGAVGVSVYNWDRERIPDEEVNSYSQELEGIYKLRDSTVVCTKCRLRIIIDSSSKQPGIEYCQCHGAKTTATLNKDHGWQPYIERQDMLVWRRQESDTGLFAYKVYGSFSDVTAEDFLQVQIDIDYRKQWDATAQELQIIDTDPDSTTSSNHSADVIYWEMIWPKLFANRDYVYQRRWIIDKEKRIVVIVSKGTDHPDAPVKPGTHRVRTYWSYMVIKPYKEFHQPGIEFGLTYFDDPGVRVPSAITAWVAVAGLSDFLSRMRQASKDYKNYKIKQNTIKSDNHIVLDQENLTEYEDLHKETNRTEESKDMIENKIMEEDNIGHDKTVKHNTPLEIMQSIKETNHIEESDIDKNDIEENENKDNVTNSMSQEEQGLLNYFFLSRLFA
ncbi:hypothetical protein KPH14_002720 [Odynerus spinipes]|uniref:Phosphatidylcholine transfer protein n=1 Tax=Odynerus spinipes TaxID=1348599 RepID=A0AAD9VMG7_9HYME|nr:hypothetical protein KPH14_002720 [Odynerus spinipes]